ncbi:MAG: hypothetical protein ACXWPG_21605, partial [Ktedonobacteraceae bacterium]
MWNGLDESWPWNPVALIGLILLCFLYGLGMSRVQKDGKHDTPFRKSRIVSFITAVLLIAIVFLTPLYT